MGFYGALAALVKLLHWQTVFLSLAISCPACRECGGLSAAGGSRRWPVIISPPSRLISCTSRWQRLHLNARRIDPTALGLFMNSVIILIDQIISLYIWLLIGSAILSWLIAFNVVNTQNRFVYMVADFLYKITEPALRPIRNIMPNLGGIDLSPVILIFGLFFIRNLLFEYFR